MLELEPEGQNKKTNTNVVVLNEEWVRLVPRSAQPAPPAPPPPPPPGDTLHWPTILVEGRRGWGIVHGDMHSVYDIGEAQRHADEGSDPYIPEEKIGCCNAERYRAKDLSSTAHATDCPMLQRNQPVAED